MTERAEQIAKVMERLVDEMEWNPMSSPGPYDIIPLFAPLVERAIEAAFKVGASGPIRNETREREADCWAAALAALTSPSPKETK